MLRSVAIAAIIFGASTALADTEPYRAQMKEAKDGLRKKDFKAAMKACGKAIEFSEDPSEGGKRSMTATLCGG